MKTWLLGKLRPMQNMELVRRFIFSFHRTTFLITAFVFVTDVLILSAKDLTLSCCLYLVVIYNFDGNVTHGLRLTIGETVHILEECSGELKSND